MKKSRIDLLFYICSANGRSNETTGRIGKKLGISQQTVSRWIKELLNENLIQWNKRSLCLSNEGIGELKKAHLILSSYFEKKKTIRIEGRVFTGLGEGAYYLSRKGYKKQFAQLGISPFFGTLNLKTKEMEKVGVLRNSAPIILKGFEEGGRKFGDIAGIHGRASFGKKKSRVLAVFPIRSHYKNDVLELVSEENLRKKFKLKDGDPVSLNIEI